MDFNNHNPQSDRKTIYDGTPHQSYWSFPDSEKKEPAFKNELPLYQLNIPISHDPILSAKEQPNKANPADEKKAVGQYEILRPKQVTLVNEIRRAFSKGATRPCVMAATGFGKSVVAGYMIRSALNKGSKRVVLIVDSLTLINQLLNTFRTMFSLECGVIQGVNPEFDLTQPVQIATPQTLANRFEDDRFGEIYRNYAVDLVIVDEAHIQYEGTKAALDYWGCRAVAFTATPYAKGMGLVYDALVKAAPMSKLIEEGDLAPYRAFCPAEETPDFSGYKVGANGDIQGAENAYSDELIGDVFEHWNRLANDRLTIGFAPTIAKCEAFAKVFRSKGVRSVAVHSKLSSDDAESLIAQFKSRDIQVLWSVAKLVKGFDVPEASCLIDCQPTYSLMRHVQKGGRVLRPHLLKNHAIILDHAGNMKRNGLYEDADIDQLSTGKKGESNADRNTKEITLEPCSNCQFEIRSTDYLCPHCGHEKEKKSFRPEADEIGWRDGELVEMKSFKFKAPKSMEDKGRLLSAIKYEAACIAAKKELKGELWAKREGWVANQYRSITGVWPDASIRYVEPKHDQAVSNYLLKKRRAYIKAIAKKEQAHV